MLDMPLLTVEQFLDQRFELPESGQWAELEAGAVKLFEPPDLDHGSTVLNLSKALAAYIEDAGPGYACFDLGLLMQTEPDTVRYPAACYFLTGQRFSLTDLAYTDQIPELVIELVSTADRREVGQRRAENYLTWGSRAVWLIDPSAQQLTAYTGPSQPVIHCEQDTLSDEQILPGFRCEVGTLFQEPDWWAG